MIVLPPKVSPGDVFTAKLWNQLRDCVAGLRPQAGSNTRITHTPQGFLISFDPAFFSWKHPFRCSLDQKLLTIDVGYINQIEPTIGGVPMSGVDATGNSVPGGIPKLSFSGQYDSENRNWIALKTTIKSDGSIIKSEILSINDWPPVLDPFIAWHPLALIKKEKGTPQLYQLTYHNLGHQWIKPTTGLGRHFFWAQ